MLLLLLSCQTDCPDGSLLDADGLCYLPEEAAGIDCSSLTYASAGQPYLLTYCTGCHSTLVTDQWRRGAPEGSDFETLDGVHTWHERIAARIEAGTMPPGGRAPAAQTERVLDWLACGAPGLDNPLPVALDSPIGDAVEVRVYGEDDGTELTVIRQVETGTRDFRSIWSTERYTISGENAWWHGYTLFDADGAVLRMVSVYPDVSLTGAGTVLVEADVEEAGITWTEKWTVTISMSEDAAPIDDREVTWDFTEVLVLADEEEHGWHLSANRGMVARWMILDAERSWSALQIGEASYGGDGFPLSALSRWQERIVAPGGWSL